MRVALMGRSLRGTMTGVVRYTHELAGSLSARSDVDLSVLVTQANDGLSGLDLQRLRAPFATPTEYHRALWEQAVVPRTVHSLRPDVYHSPNYILPLALRCPTVVTVHDMAFLDASLHRRRSQVYLSALTTAAIRKADRIICVSQHTFDELGSRFPAAADRARVVGEGVSARFAPADEEAIEKFRADHGLSHPYVLFLGTREPRKNLARLVQAFGQAMQTTGAMHDLVLVGNEGWKNDDVWSAIAASPVKDRIRVLGYLPDDDLPTCLSGAEVLAYPSLLEGYGLPVIEAMACGTAVLTSNTTSLPEVVSNAAICVDPFDIEAIADGLVRLLLDPATRDTLVAAGHKRAAELSWPAVAKQTCSIYKEVAR